jgi:hypothetical protein
MIRTPERESLVLSACLRHLERCPGVFAWRNNTGVAVINGRRVAFGYRGSADILAVYQGRFYAFECKSATGSQSDAQRVYQARVEAAGGVYAIVRGVSDLPFTAGFTGRRRYHGSSDDE